MGLEFKNKCSNIKMAENKICALVGDVRVFCLRQYHYNCNKYEKILH